MTFDISLCLVFVMSFVTVFFLRKRGRKKYKLMVPFLAEDSVFKKKHEMSTCKLGVKIVQYSF